MISVEGANGEASGSPNRLRGAIARGAAHPLAGAGGEQQACGGATGGSCLPLLPRRRRRKPEWAAGPPEWRPTGAGGGARARHVSAVHARDVAAVADTVAAWPARRTRCPAGSGRRDLPLQYCCCGVSRVIGYVSPMRRAECGAWPLP